MHQQTRRSLQTNLQKQESANQFSFGSSPFSPVQRAEASNSLSGAASVPEAFKRDPLSSVAYIKSQQELEELLKSYGFDTRKQENLDRIKNFWDKLPQDRSKYNTAPQIIEKLTPFEQRSEKKNETIKEVKENNARLAPDVSPNSGKTLERADTRNRDEIEKDGGLHGWGGSMSVDHARSWAAEWENKSQRERNDWLQNWKSQTRSKVDEMPYVATGEVSQKSGNNYRFEVPKEITCETGNNAKLVFNGSKLEEATVIAITGRSEVVFLTGIPNKYIK